VKLSVVVPCYNEQAVIEKTHSEIIKVLEGLILKHKILDYELIYIYIDDGSLDNTQSILKRIASSDKRIKVVVLSRNFGHQAALVAGIHQAVGEIVITMDADLQDPPQVIEEMIDKFKEGYDIVYGARKKQKRRIVSLGKDCLLLFFIK
jgi:dolichol-phosphate mannosyltransferase